MDTFVVVLQCIFFFGGADNNANRMSGGVVRLEQRIRVEEESRKHELLIMYMVYMSVLR